MIFDVIRFLKENSIPFRTEGTNVGEDWVGTQRCPFCGDSRYHLGINLSSGGYSCWRCGKKGWIYEYISAYMGMTTQEVKIYGRTFLKDGYFVKHNRINNKSLEFPASFKDLTPYYLNYLTSRKFDISIAARYGLRCTDQMDDEWKYRVIIPVYRNYQLVGWLGRATVAEMEPRYKNSPNRINVCNLRDCIYNIDSMSRISMLVEGPTDVWNVGDSTGAIIGLEYTNAQMKAIKAAGVEELTVVFDGEEQAYRRAISVAKNMDMLGVKSYVIRLQEGQDPGSLSEEDATELRREVFGKKNAG